MKTIWKFSRRDLDWNYVKCEGCQCLFSSPVGLTDDGEQTCCRNCRDSDGYRAALRAADELADAIAAFSSGEQGAVYVDVAYRAYRALRNDTPREEREVTFVPCGDSDARDTLDRALDTEDPNEVPALALAAALRQSWGESERLTRRWEAYRDDLINAFTDLAAADELELAESAYRTAHDLKGDGSPEAGRAWDALRRAGNKYRALRNDAPREEPGA